MSSPEPNPPITDLIQLPAEERMARVVGYAFGGEHHVRKLEKFAHPRWPHWQFNVCLCGALATEDADQLSRLVVACSEYGVRAELDGAGPRYVKVRLHPRYSRDGDFSERVRNLAEHARLFDTPRKLHFANVEAGHPVSRIFAAGPEDVKSAGRQMRAAMQAEIDANRGFEYGDMTCEQLEAAQNASKRAQQAFEYCCAAFPLVYDDNANPRTA